MTTNSQPSGTPLWLRALAGFALALMAGAAVYAAAIALANVSRIGV